MLKADAKLSCGAEPWELLEGRRSQETLEEQGWG